MSIVNEAVWDRVLRVVLGSAILYLGWSGTVTGLSGAVLRIFGFLPLVTGIIGWSPLYAILGFRTRKAFHPTDSSSAPSRSK